MDEKSREELDRIIALGSDSLSEEEKAFLNARRMYLNAQQKEDFKNVLIKDNQEEEPKKRSRKI